MSSRSIILNRVRQALRAPAPRPPDPLPKEVFLPIPSDELVLRFQKELEALKGVFYLSKDLDDARTWFDGIVRENNFRKIAASPHPDVHEMLDGLEGSLQSLVFSLRFLGQKGERGFSLESVDLGITNCDCLVACTGSVVLTARSGFGRALSILPPAHLVIAKRSQLVAHLSDAYALLKTTYGSGQRPRGEAGNLQPSSYPSMLTIISGPSRTSDIEKILVLGAHGPQKLFVLLLDF